MKREDVNNKEDYVNYILLELYNKIHPVDFGNFYMEIFPTGGIDNFRNFLDELHDNKLVTKTSEPKGYVFDNPGLVKLDLRYGISLKGIDHLKANNIISNNTMKEKKDVFVTYSWDDETHNEKVISFTDFLRQKGFEAEMDKLQSQKESATDFHKMMHQAMTDYKKVIVVLSKGYKEKAENFSGGVGNEYGLIIKDLETSKNKYILVSFEKINDNITPLYFKGRHIIDLSVERNFNELYAKLKDENIIEFSEVGNEKPNIEKKNIQQFQFKKDNIEILDIETTKDFGMLFAKLYTKVKYNVSLVFKNDSNSTISDYNIEVYYPINSTDYDTQGRIENGYKIISYESNPKLFSQQTKRIVIEPLMLNNVNAEGILNDKMIVKIYSENGIVEREFNINQILYTNDNFRKELLTLDKFQHKNFR